MYLIGVCLSYLAVCLITIHYTSWGCFPFRWRQIAQLEWTRPSRYFKRPGDDVVLALDGFYLMSGFPSHWQM
ncbi:uncharacterized protein F5891DRAFT_1039377 [Suillus fuscotomentosus]|uniref:Uncharacterized protein n=1 Tax=Suillus fuscotomentosus TaxID=1912939 RepID=A0AAD4HJ02_9AGAM|nr:uncharacterized protein F5891DRAFT_1039377 [Suillus fuscotomentosus]KAG1899400.1 hypothetical protein F5891DRAFT_1039377 [Suillus fuscotomentosus]